MSNKYRRWYLSLMQAARDRAPVADGERHHVVPRSLGGTSGEIVKLTYREHFVAHWLLTKFTVGEARRKMCYALWAMVRVPAGYKRSATARQYEIAKRAQREAVTGRTVSDITRARISAGKSNQSEETRQRISIGQKRSMTPERRAAISARNRARKVTEEARRNMSAAQSNRSSRPEHSAKMMGHAVTEATRQKMSAARKSYWDRRNGMAP